MSGPAGFELVQWFCHKLGALDIASGIIFSEGKPDVFAGYIAKITDASCLLAVMRNLHTKGRGDLISRVLTREVITRILSVAGSEAQKRKQILSIIMFFQEKEEGKCKSFIFQVLIPEVLQIMVKNNKDLALLFGLFWSMGVSPLNFEDSPLWPKVLEALQCVVRFFPRALDPDVLPTEGTLPVVKVLLGGGQLGLRWPTPGLLNPLMLDIPVRLAWIIACVSVVIGNSLPSSSQVPTPAVATAFRTGYVVNGDKAAPDPVQEAQGDEGVEEHKGIEP